MKQLQKPLIHLAIAALCLVALPACAQQMVHAMSGTVASVMPNLKMIEVTTTDGGDSHFQWVRSSKDRLNFDKSVSDDATPVNASAVKGDHIIVYYIGDGDPRVAVALRDLGSADVQTVTGTVVKFDKHDHLLTVKDSNGAEVTFHLDPKTVADTTNGVQENFKFDLDKGSWVHVTSTQVDGAPTAWLVSSTF